MFKSRWGAAAVAVAMFAAGFGARSFVGSQRDPVPARPAHQGADLGPARRHVRRLRLVHSSSASEAAERL